MDKCGPVIHYGLVNYTRLQAVEMGLHSVCTYITSNLLLLNWSLTRSRLNDLPVVIFVICKYISTNIFTHWLDAHFLQWCPEHFIYFRRYWSLPNAYTVSGGSLWIEIKQKGGYVLGLYLSDIWFILPIKSQQFNYHLAGETDRPDTSDRWEIERQDMSGLSIL